MISIGYPSVDKCRAVKSRATFYFSLIDIFRSDYFNYPIRFQQIFQLLHSLPSWDPALVIINHLQSSSSSSQSFPWSSPYSSWSSSSLSSSLSSFSLSFVIVVVHCGYLSAAYAFLRRYQCKSKFAKLTSLIILLPEIGIKKLAITFLSSILNSLLLNKFF